ncbi:MAG: energy transducer TonB [Steroidobacteraceae bacterium]|jgi:TonB family protein
MRKSEVVIVSTDDELLIELGPVLGDRYRVHTVDRLSAIDGAARTARWLAIIDATAILDGPPTLLRIERQFPKTPLIVIAADPSQWTPSVLRSNVVTVVAREDIAGQALSDALAAAESRLRDAVSPESTSLDQSAADAAGGGARRGMPLAIVVGGLAAVLIVGIVWFLTHKSNPPRQIIDVRAGVGASAATPETETELAGSVHSQSVLELLSAARAAFRDQRLLLPRLDGERGDSALELYTQVLAQDPSNEEALDGIRRLYAIGRARIQSDLASGKLDEAVRLAEVFRGAGVDPDSLREIDASIAAARPKWLASRAQASIADGDLTNAEQLISQVAGAGADRGSVAELRRSLEAKKLEQQLTAMSVEVKAAIDAGTLLDPANDNARTRLQAMRTLSRNHPVTLTAQRELQAALLSRALDAVHADQFDAAQRYIGGASEIAITPEVTDAKRQLQIETDLVEARAAAAAAEARAVQVATAVTRPATSTSLAPTKSSSTYLTAKPLSALNVIYPQSAIDADAQGSVTIEFTLSPDGTASNPTVVASKPVGMFDRAATQAVLKGRYDVSALSDQKPARARIRFDFKAAH